jgi:hypothetical protein
MNSVIFLTIGIVLLTLPWARGKFGSAFVRSRPVPEASRYLAQLPPSGLLGRCFSEEDVRFVASLRSQAVLRLLLQERRWLALEWLRLTRHEARRLLGLHVRTVRFAADLRPATEFKLLAQAGGFLFTSEVLEVLVRWYGPFRAHAYVQSIQGLAGVLAALGGGIARSISPAAAGGAAPAHGE